MSLKGKTCVAGKSRLRPARAHLMLLLVPSLVFMFSAGLRGAPADSRGTPQNTNRATDPGLRGGPPGAGSPVAGLTSNQLAFFTAGEADFNEIDSVSGTISGTGKGLGPRFNAEGCAQCHAQPAVGGTSPITNPHAAGRLLCCDPRTARQTPGAVPGISGTDCRRSARAGPGGIRRNRAGRSAGDRAGNRLRRTYPHGHRGRLQGAQGTAASRREAWLGADRSALRKHR